MIELSHNRIRLILYGLVLSNIMAGVEGTIVATARPFIVADLHRFDLTVWIFVAYLLAQTVATNLWGKLSDLFGRQRLYQLSIVIFMCGSTVCGLATSMSMLIVGRTIQGVGAGGLFTLTMTIMGDILAPRDRGKYVGYMAGAFAVATVLGPLVGGLIVDHYSWRWIFFLMPPFGAISLAMSFFTLRLPFARRAQRIDYLGALTMTIWVTAIMLYLTFGEKDGWASPKMLIALATFAIGLATFLWVETRAAEPILPLHLFRERLFTIVVTTHFVVGTVLTSVSIMAPLFLQIVGGANATRSGLLTVPLTIGMLTTSVISGRRISTTGKYRIYPIVGTGMMVFAATALATMGTNTGKALPAAYMFIFGMGMGNTMQTITVAVQNRVRHQDLGVATSATGFFRGLGQTAGSAVYSAILVGRLDHWLPRLVPDGALVNSASLRDSPRQILEMPDPVRIGIVESFSRSLHVVFLAGIPACVIAFILAWRVPEFPLRSNFTPAAPGDAARDDAVADDDAVAATPVGVHA
ncbi:MAG: MDR family MFS transporter [Acidimicrobiales bacterium]